MAAEPPRAPPEGRLLRLWKVIRGHTRESDPQDPREIEKLGRPELQHLFDAIRQEIKREDDLINQRNTWCILATTALVAGIFTVAAKADSLPAPLVGAVMVTFSLAGLTLSLFCVRAVWAARNQIEYLFRVFNDRDQLFLEQGFFRPFGKQETHRSGIGYAEMTPRIIAAVWVVVLIASIAFWASPAHRSGPENQVPREIVD